MNTLGYFQQEHKLIIEESRYEVPAAFPSWVNSLDKEDIIRTYFEFITNTEADREEIKKLSSFIRKELERQYALQLIYEEEKAYHKKETFKSNLGNEISIDKINKVIATKTIDFVFDDAIIKGKIIKVRHIENCNYFGYLKKDCIVYENDDCRQFDLYPKLINGEIQAYE